MTNYVPSSANSEASTDRTTERNIIYATMWRRLPWWLVNLFYTPSKAALGALQFQSESKRVASKILRENADRGDHTGKDILSVLGAYYLEIISFYIC